MIANTPDKLTSSKTTVCSHLQIPQNHENKNMLLLHTLEQQNSDDAKCWPQYKQREPSSIESEGQNGTVLVKTSWQFLQLNQKVEL